eukprot:scaffold9290_cov63-Phaeocystis_antarctica.AAC.7
MTSDARRSAVCSKYSRFEPRAPWALRITAARCCSVRPAAGPSAGLATKASAGTERPSSRWIG